MKVLWLEPIGGISGDMCLGALVDLGVPLEVIEAGLASLGVSGWRLTERRRETTGISAKKVDVTLEHEEHAHRHLADIRAIIDAGKLGERARAIATEAFERLARAEAKVHGTTPEEVHFHEVGAVDAIVDICGTAIAIEHLAPDAIHAAPPPLGTGFVTAAHGRIPVPPPAVLELLEGIEVAPSETVGELTTPTGAALLATLAQGGVGPMPAMRLERVGYGAGDADWPDRPNVLRAVLGTATEAAGEGGTGVLSIEANLDDMSPEHLPPAIDALLEAGALDVTVAPVLMKKGRPGFRLEALCRPAAREAVVRRLLEETTTFGVRIHADERVELERSFETVTTPFGEVRIKVGRLGGEVVSFAPEHEDCLALARAAGVPVIRVHSAAVGAYGARGRLSGVE